MLNNYTGVIDKLGFKALRSRNNEWILGLIFSVLAVIFVFQLEGRDPHVVDIKARAERIFEIDKKYHCVPLSQVAALSIALEFGNYQGAEQILKDLERTF